MSDTTKHLLLQDFAALLERAGTSKINPSAYDTAWVARISASHNPKLSAFPEALGWVAAHQHTDGSWGEGGIAERLIATLAGTLAMAEKGQRARDAHQVELGLSFIWRSLPQLQNSSILPVGFELLLGALIEEGKAVKLNLPDWLGIHYEPYRQQKLALLSRLEPLQLRNTSAIFSLEFLGDKVSKNPEAFVKNGGVGTSPSATASVLRFVTDPELRKQMLNYLAEKRILDKSGAGWGCLADFGLFEITWVLHNLRISRYTLHPMLRPLVETKLDRLANERTPLGLPMSADFISDADDTIESYIILKECGRECDPTPIESYWKNTHLVTYQYERDPSITVNMRGVDLYKRLEMPDRVKQLMGFLDQARQGMPFWEDKWNISPYYATSTAVVYLSEIDHALIEPAINWIIYTQNEDGGWGCEIETAEETAFALQAIFYYAEAAGWNMQLRSSAQAGAEYLRSCYRPFVLNEPPLWIGKNRYTPHLIVRSAIIAALLLADTHGL